MKRLAFYNLNYVVLMVFFLCFLPLSIAIAIDNENLFVKKYRFGFERRSDNGKPIIYLSHNLAPEENISNELTNDVVVKLVVKPH
ncbi:TPA: hypothetical protein ODN21_003594, partial [Escherichia coli]|nr:hypothetical protein [Escherichia coli]